MYLFFALVPERAVTSRRRDVELSVERRLVPEGAGVARLTIRYEVAPGDDGPSRAELAAAFETLTADLDALAGVPLAVAPVGRPDRDLKELVEAYRPRQRELVDLLRDEGELTGTEHARLVEYLVARGAEPSSAPPAASPSLVDRPLAALPAVFDRPSDSARPAAELLETYQITSLKQAGAVRARRQISYAEYMALKRHFEAQESVAASKRSAETPRA